MAGVAIKRTLTADIIAQLTQNVIAWCWCLRIDVAAPVGTMRYTDHSVTLTDNVDGSSQTWTAGVSLQVGEVEQGRKFILNPSTFSVANLDHTFGEWAKTPGLNEATVMLYAVWFNAAGSLAGAVKTYEGRVDNHRHLNRSEFAIKPWRAQWSRRVVAAINGLSPKLPAPLAEKEGEKGYWNTTA